MIHVGLMRKFRLKEVVKLVGIAAIVASLVFVGLQIRQEQDIAVAQLLMEATARRIELSQLMSENREAWEKGLRGEELSDLDYATFASIADAYENHVLLMVVRTTLLDIKINAAFAVRAYAIQLYAYPGLRAVFYQRCSFAKLVGWGDDGGFFCTDVQDQLAILDDERPSITDMQISFF